MFCVQATRGRTDRKRKIVMDKVSPVSVDAVLNFPQKIEASSLFFLKRKCTVPVITVTWLGIVSSKLFGDGEVKER